MKAKISLLKDEYAIESGEFWVCVYGGCCARGKTPVLAYEKLMSHFKSLKRSRLSTTQIRAYA